MLFALAFLIQFLVGGLTGIMVASPPLDYSLNDTYFVVAHFHYTLFAGSIFGLFAGIYYWFPKATGAMLREGLGKVHFVLMVIGTNLTFFPMFILGYDGMVRRVADYPHRARWELLNSLSTAGSGIIAVCDAGLHRECVGVAATPPAGRERPVGGAHARVVDDVAAAAAQLHRPARRSGRSARSSSYGWSRRTDEATRVLPACLGDPARDIGGRPVGVRVRPAAVGQRGAQARRAWPSRRSRRRSSPPRRSPRP